MPFFLKSGKDLQSLCQLDRIHEKRCFKKTKSKSFCIIATSFKVALFGRKAWHGSTEITNGEGFGLNHGFKADHHYLVPVLTYYMRHNVGFCLLEPSNGKRTNNANIRRLRY